MEAILAKPQTKINTLDDYKQARDDLKKISAELYKLWAHKDYETDRQKKYMKASEILFTRLEKFARTYKKARNRTVSAVSRYLTQAGTKYDINEDVYKMVDLLISHDLLRKTTVSLINGGIKPSYYVVGMHHNVADNSYLPDSKGKYRRHFSRTYALQAFKVRDRYCGEIEFLEGHRGLNIPRLEDHYQKVFVSNSKHEPLFYCSKNDYKEIEKLSKGELV